MKRSWLFRRSRITQQQHSRPAYVGDAHRQVLADAAGITAYVDESLAPYLELAWSHGIETLNSCQGTADEHGIYPTPDEENPGYVHLRDGRQIIDLLVLWGWVGFTHEMRLAVDSDTDNGCRTATVYFPSVAAMEHPPDYRIHGADGEWTMVRRGRITPF
ncbi:hypothetical protein [Frankia sp. CiP1_Cm_nod2]|uniref:hypothetical protein n=1 Tax=Frankia sp. CiP1_Cm_nod2 TaxID=2897161 RepID=UPI00202493FE